MNLIPGKANPSADYQPCLFSRKPRILRSRGSPPLRALLAARRHRAQANPSDGIVERLHRTLLDEHFRVEGRRTWFETLDEMQTVLDQYLVDYNTNRIRAAA
jgi:hypothetical protein